MKRILLGLGGLVVAIGALLGGGAQPVLAKITDNFVINNFDVDYHLTRDTDGRSQLQTTERITATFPQTDQNHGIERAIPTSYDGHSTHVAVTSVTDEKGVTLPYNDSRTSGDAMIVRIGDADTYVHGVKTYVITYTQHDVTKFFANTNDDELYWDTNGVGWQQPIEQLRAKVTIDAALTKKLNGATSCYQGPSGSTEKCAAGQRSVAGGDAPTTLVFNATRPLAAGENVSFAIGFAPQTFAAYQQTAEEKRAALIGMIWLVAVIVGSIIAIMAIIWMSVVRAKIMNRAKGRGTIIPEYLPPKNASALVSSVIIKRPALAMTAQLLSFAVRHYVKIYQTKEKTLFKTAQYELEVVKDTTDLAKEEQRLLASLFGGKPKVGARFAMKKLQDDYTIGRWLMKDAKTLRDETRGNYTFYEKAVSEAKKFQTAAIILVVAGALTLSPLLLVAGAVGFVYAYTLWPLTDKGAELRDYLEGLKLYISVAEVERIKLLQSPEGAEKVGSIDGDNPKQLVKLYERVLPYAVLFGYEKDWLKQLGAYYDAGAGQPDWYAGNGVFNAVVFASALNTFSDQSSSYGTSSGSSSSMGGSGGGGFSGGGGGGGGGGGW